MRGKFKVILALLVITGLGFVLVIRFQGGEKSADTAALDSVVASPYREVVINIADGDTFGALMDEAGIDHADTSAIVAGAEDVYSVTKIRAGKDIKLYFDKQTNEFAKLVYRIGTEDDLIATKEIIIIEDPDSFEGDGEGITEERGNEYGLISTALAREEVKWNIKRVPIPYEIRVQDASGIVEEILYVSALDKGFDELLILDFAQVLQWSVDFAIEVRSGDTFKVIYEARYLDGKYIMPGTILAVEYNNAGTIHQGFYFEESEENKGHFDQEGNSVQKMFLKAPVNFKYITSGFTTGQRYISAFNISTGHRAIDYAANYGTPIIATADGTVTSAGWNSQGYGYLTSIHHNDTFSTNYAHQSRIAVSRGQKVKQGDIIGYVGSTGLSTGPHLHYELVKYGTKVNPLTEILPPGKPIKEENQERFKNVLEVYQGQLENVKVE